MLALSVLFTATMSSAWAIEPAQLAGDWLAPAEDADDVDALITLSPSAQPGTWRGRIKAIRVTRPDQKWHDDSLCNGCPPPKKGQPFKGLEVVWDMREADGKLVSGRILDPGDGRVYDCEMRLSADGKTLAVTAYKGLKLLGHTMSWQRP